MRDQGIEVGFIHREELQEGSDFRAGQVDRWTGGTRDLIACVMRQRPNWLWIQLSDMVFHAGERPSFWLGAWSG